MEKISNKIPKNWGKKVRKNSALLENIQKNNADYSKENKNTINNPPKDSIKKIPQKKVELFKNHEKIGSYFGLFLSMIFIAISLALFFSQIISLLLNKIDKEGKVIMNYDK